MNFKETAAVKYIMKNKIIRAICLILSVTVLVITPLIMIKSKNQVKAESKTTVLNIWQIDGFEGGKGSRASYLNSVSQKFLEDEKIYVNAVTLSSEAVRQNLNNGTIPDMISFPSGIYGVENYFSNYCSWCYGCYCLISLDENADFSDVNNKNTAVNEGKENFTAIAALFLGLDDAQFFAPTNAYLQLLNGKFKYLLGTQRDIFRFKARGVPFKVKAVEEFNDLYQNICITATNVEKISACKTYIKKLRESSNDLYKIGMLGGNDNYDEEFYEIRDKTYSYTLKSPISKEIYFDLKKNINEKNLNKIKVYLNN